MELVQANASTQKHLPIVADHHQQHVEEQLEIKKVFAVAVFYHIHHTQPQTTPCKITTQATI